jgi:two-component system, NarL family, response regulator DesR
LRRRHQEALARPRLRLNRPVEPIIEAETALQFDTVAAPIRILLVEDNEVFREALELLLGLRSDVEVVASVGDGYEAVPAARKHQPDVVLMDYRLPGLDGVQATAAIREACPEVAVVCLTASIAPREFEALVEAGAVACLSKDQELDEIIGAIEQAAADLARSETR